MAIVTISRGPFSGGAQLAACVAAQLGYRCVSREAVVEKAVSWGASEREIRAHLERPPGVWDRARHARYVYLTLVQAALAEELRAGRAVYHGNAGHLLLAGVSHVMRVCVIAPLAFRVDLAMQRLNMTRDAATAHLQRADQHARRWVRYLYGVDLADPGLYDIVFNLETLTVTQSSDVIVGLLRERCFLETAESRAAMEDLALASRVRARLVLTKQTSDLEVETVARRGNVSISGTLLSSEQLARARVVALDVPGVTGVDAGVSGRIAV